MGSAVSSISNCWLDILGTFTVWNGLQHVKEYTLFERNADGNSHAKNTQCVRGTQMEVHMPRKHIV